MEKSREKIIGIFFDVYNELGHGFLESVYGQSLEFAFNSGGLKARRKIKIPVGSGDKVLVISKPICLVETKFSWS